MLGQVVVHTERVTIAVAEVLANRARRIRADIQHRRGIRGRRRDDDRVAHRVVLFEGTDHLRDRGLLLTNRVVDADHAFAALIDDRVDGDGGLSCLPVADDQFALSAADWHHAIDGLQTCLQRLLDRLTIDDARREALDRQKLFRRDRTFAVDRLAERVHDAAQHLVTDRYGDDAAGAFDLVAFLDFLVVAEEDRTDALLFEIERDAKHTVRELEHIAGHCAFDTMHARDPVAYHAQGSYLSD